MKQRSLGASMMMGAYMGMAGAHTDFYNPEPCPYSFGMNAKMDVKQKKVRNNPSKLKKRKRKSSNKQKRGKRRGR